MNEIIGSSRATTTFPEHMSQNYQSGYQIKIYPLQWLKEIHFLEGSKMTKLKSYIILWINIGSGRLVVDSQSHEICDGNIYCIYPGQLCKLELRGSLDGYFLSLSSEFYYLADLESARMKLNPISGYMKFFALQIDEKIQSEAGEVLTKMRREFVSDFSLRTDILEGLVKIFMLYLSRVMDTKQSLRSYDRESLIVIQFLSLLRKHFVNKKFVADYADELCISPGYLNTIVKRVSGFPASHHIQQHLILEAKRQLIQNDSTMKEIAFNLGFNDQAHFSRFFKNCAGINFTKFRQLIYTSEL